MVFRRPGDMRLQTGNKRKIFGLSGYTIFFTFWLLLPLLVIVTIFMCDGKERNLFISLASQ